MPSAEINKDISSLAPEAGTEAGAQVLRRLTVVLLWTFALWGIVMAYVFWQMPHTAEVVQTIDKTVAGPATHGPEIPKPFTIKLTGFFLLSNVLGVTLLHALAPRAVVRNRL